MKSDFFREAEEILSNHGVALPLLASGSNAEFVFFTHDMDRRLIYLSESSFRVLGIRESTWLNKKVDLFTDHPWNNVLEAPDHVLDPNRVQTIQVEILNDQGLAIKVQVWRRLVLHNDIPIGVVGMVKRLSNVNELDPMESVLDLEAIRKRITTLSDRERQVVELVVCGEMNKSIALSLNVAIRTVEARRAKAMKKMGAKRLTELVRMWIAAKKSNS
ncbi:MAG: LuxR C-terminal-related transcriptional regulator [Pirellula sp.]